MRRPLLSLLALGLLTAAPVPAQPALNPSADTLRDPIFPELGQVGLDVRHYDLHLTVTEPGTREVRGVVTLTLTSTRPLTQVRLDFLGPEVEAVRWNDRAVPFGVDEKAAKLTVTPPAPLRPGATARLTVEYAGTPGELEDPDFPTPLLLGWQAVPAEGGRAGANFVLSEPNGTHTFLPSNDHPSDKATFTTRVTVPRGYVAAASGVETGRVDAAGTSTFTFSQREPIPTYALGVFVDRFLRVDESAVPVGVGGSAVVRRDFFPPETPGPVRAAYVRTDEALRLLSEWFGPYPFGAYGVAVVTPRLPALETATLSTMPLNMSTERTAVHEIAHQWFGNAVTPATWPDVWLSEGMAAYSELLWTEHLGGDGQAYAARWHANLTRAGTRPLRATRAGELFDLSTYQRGALTFHALRAEIGDAAFRDFLRAYVTRFSAGAGTVSTPAFLAFVRERAGAGAEATVRRWVEERALPPLPVVGR
ncbi:M1 family metallopeptidase [Deinococcus sp. SDU3-2]|uniref:Aminopeptidase N n=1 Tax=Deinococcus terrestris TaxID=2651870 RepID=A0A7X1NW46_9DEIO|nr:M1 family metallopeptidase [Deinococcus terrestris]MPY66893.1 M1 family metallopeptidase [Deinococcus terrestris]